VEYRNLRLEAEWQVPKQRVLDVFRIITRRLMGSDAAKDGKGVYQN
jgi:hypothetical protein